MVKALLEGNSVVTVQGQITIPKSLRNKFKLKTGDMMEFLLTENSALIMRKIESKKEVNL